MRGLHSLPSKEDIEDEFSKTLLTLKKEKIKIKTDLSKELDTKSKMESNLNTKIASLEGTIGKLKGKNTSLEQSKKNIQDELTKKLHDLEKEKDKIILIHGSFLINKIS